MVYDFAFDNLQFFTLLGDVSPGDTSISVPPSVASDIATALQGLGKRYPLILSADDPLTSTSTIEIVYAIGADTSTDIITVLRAREGTSAQNWPAATPARCALTAGALEALQPKDGVWHDLVYVGDMDVTVPDNSLSLSYPSDYVVFPFLLFGRTKEIGPIGIRRFTIGVGTEFGDTYYRGVGEWPETRIQVDGAERNYLSQSGTDFVIWLDTTDETTPLVISWYMSVYVLGGS